jgi:hypothetical protein
VVGSDLRLVHGLVLVLNHVCRRKLLIPRDFTTRRENPILQASKRTILAAQRPFDPSTEVYERAGKIE